MAGMEALGRLNDIIPNVTTNAILKVRGSSCVQVCVTGATAVVTLAYDSSYAGGFANAGYFIKNIYWATAANRTVAWNKLTYNLANAPYLTGGPGGVPGALSTFTLGTTTGLTTAAMAVFHVFTSEFSDPYNYLKVTVSGSGVAQILPMDPVHQRAPANLEILSS
jgi:hypothetical protein